MSDIEKRIETAKTIQVNRRNYRRARDRALARLAGIHREEYLDLLNQERESDALQGKTWLDLSGRTYLDIALDRATRNGESQAEIGQANADRESEGNLG